MRNSSSAFRAILLSALAAALLCGCAEKKQTAAQGPKPVRVAETTQKDVPYYYDSFGTLNALNNVDIKSQVTGQIAEIRFNEGQYVKTGDILYMIDKRLYSAEVSKAEAVLKTDQAKVKVNQFVAERDRQIAETRAISEQDYAKILAQLDESIAVVEMDKALLQLAKINLDYCDIRSPVDGVTGKKLVDIGNIVPANNGPTLVNVKTIDPLYVDFTIPEKYLGEIRDAMTAESLKVLATEEEFGISQSGSVFEGTVELIDNSVNNQTGTILVRGIIPNGRKKLWAGQFVKTRLIFKTLKDAVLAPAASVQAGQNGSYLFVVDAQNKAVMKNVTVGQRQNDFVVINSGNVKPGEKAVTVGQMSLKDGTPVSILGDKSAIKKSGH